jgi:hypothetical protein
VRARADDPGLRAGTADGGEPETGAADLLGFLIATVMFLLIVLVPALRRKREEALQEDAPQRA